MKIDRYQVGSQDDRVKLCFTLPSSALLAIWIATLSWVTPAESQENPTPQAGSVAPRTGPSDPAGDTSSQAALLLDQVIDRLANGQAFDCKVRQQVRTAGREVVGVGTYVQVGGGTGQFSFQIKMHDGDGKHTLQQISDGRLAWTRSEIAGNILLSRVDVGWLDEGARTLRRNDRIKPSMLVGGPCEMLDTIRRDYDLKLGLSSLGGQPLWVIIASLKQAQRDRVSAMLGRDNPPELYPTRVNIAVAKADDPETGFGMGLPVRIEHLSDPQAGKSETDGGVPAMVKTRRLISLLEFYSIQPISPPPVEKFRFENQDTEVDFVNETSRYEDRFNIRVSAKERARYR